MTDHYTRWGKNWEARHKEERKAYRAKWYKDNKLRIKEQQKEYRFQKDLAQVMGKSYEQNVQREG